MLLWIDFSFRINEKSTMLFAIKMEKMVIWNFFNNFFQNFNIFNFFYEFILECNDYFGFKNGQTCANAGDCYLGIGCECDDGFSSENCHLGREFYFFLFCFVFLGFLTKSMNQHIYSFGSSWVLSVLTICKLIYSSG